MNEPKELDAGTRIKWDFDDVRADGSVSFLYCLRGPSKIDIEPTASGGVVSVDVSTADSTSWVAGLYKWQLYLVIGSDKEIISYGKLTINPDFLAVNAGYDARSHSERMLDAIEARLENRIISDHEKYTIDGRSLDRIPIIELHNLRRVYKRKVARERGLNKGPAFKRVLSRLPADRKSVV